MKDVDVRVERTTLRFEARCVTISRLLRARLRSLLQQKVYTSSRPQGRRHKEFKVGLPPAKFKIRTQEFKMNVLQRRCFTRGACPAVSGVDSLSLFRARKCTHRRGPKGVDTRISRLGFHTQDQDSRSRVKN